MNSPRMAFAFFFDQFREAPMGSNWMKTRLSYSSEGIGQKGPSFTFRPPEESRHRVRWELRQQLLESLRPGCSAKVVACSCPPFPRRTLNGFQEMSHLVSLRTLFGVAALLVV